MGDQPLEHGGARTQGQEQDAGMAGGAARGLMVPYDRAEEERQKRAVLLRVLRMVFVTLLMTVTLLFILQLDTGRPAAGDSAFSVRQWWYVPLTIAVVLAAGVILLDEYAPRRLTTLSGLFFGLVAGLLATFAASFVIELLGQTYDITTRQNPEGERMLFAVKVLIGMSLSYLGMATVLRTQEDFRLIIPYVEFSKRVRGPRPLVVDSSALIDARIVEMCATGFVAVPVVIPKFVIEELQRLGDSSDRMIRARGKRGLEMVTRLQRLRGIEVIVDSSPVAATLVDQQLVELAKTLTAMIVTTDAGLNKVADIQGVKVLNVNELAAAMKPALLPGSRVVISLVKRGEQEHQGVGYLADGTMVVVDQGAGRVGDEVTVEVASSLQTAGGRLIFARLPDGEARVVSEKMTAALPEVVEEAQGAQGEQGASDGEEVAERDGAAGEVSDGTGSGGGMFGRVRVAPPTGPVEPEQKGPQPPTRVPRNPNRNPRR